MKEDGDCFFIPSSYSRIVARVLGLQERDLPRLLRGTGLPSDILLAGDESRLTGRQQLQVLANAKAMDHSAHFGLRLGQQLQPSAHGPLGYLALSSPDLRTALQSLRDFLPLRIPFVQLELQEREDRLICSLEILLEASQEERKMLLESFVLVIQALVASFLGRKLTDARARFEFPRPHYHALYPDYIDASIDFDCPSSQLLIPASLLEELNPSGDADSYAAAREMCASLLAQTPANALSMTDRVKRFLLAQPINSVSEEQVARSLFVSKRTLARRLQREGSGYRRIRDDILAEMAARHLRDERFSVESIAALLGYHDSANFRRAFRRWHGCSPSDFRHGAGLR
ncbi:AraC family transcriptional regulator [Pseudohalioglobus lutimaris]|uniref:AraC family transcriptional regulator n=1 Tax=Pseudohalioglobus lutimaris TaxID=1737061 RepID=A0A2N5X0T0_9GAMM|nr:AraC family transcriptional regulator [Pseudohalioglobus lutimaris]PLW68103.1 AraC family transcriptional regulator [Pseudohalioglobus lutimaris]